MSARSGRAIETVFLDAGGVLVHPNWARVAEALARHGIVTSAAALTAAEPHAKREMDLASLMARTDDRQRGWIYFEAVLRHAGLEATEAAREALAEVRAYHDVHNVWESVPADVAPEMRVWKMNSETLANVMPRPVKKLWARKPLASWDGGSRSAMNAR